MILLLGVWFLLGICLQGAVAKSHFRNDVEFGQGLITTKLLFLEQEVSLVPRLKLLKQIYLEKCITNEEITDGILCLRLWSLSCKSRRKTMNSSENKTLDNVCTCVFPGCHVKVRLFIKIKTLPSALAGIRTRDVRLRICNAQPTDPLKQNFLKFYVFCLPLVISKAILSKRRFSEIRIIGKSENWTFGYSENRRVGNWKILVFPSVGTRFRSCQSTFHYKKDL